MDVTPDAKAPTPRQPWKLSFTIALVILLVGSCAAGSAALMAKVSEVGPVASSFWRFALAAPLLVIGWIWVVNNDPGPKDGRELVVSGARDWAFMALSGACFAGAQMMWFIGLEYTSVANATLLLALTPLLAAPFLAWRFGEVIGRGFWLGMVLAIAGVAGLTLQSGAISQTALIGDLYCLISAVSLAGYFVTLTRLRRRYRAIPVIAGSSLFCAMTLGLVMLPGWIAGAGGWLPQTGEGWAVVLALALISQVFGHGLMTFALAHLPGRFAGASVLIQPVWASALAWPLLGESLGSVQLFGGVLVLAGIYVASRKSAADDG
ncbi:MAG: DMT family transporter [Alphaproteobacteria bacterium]|nr:DMT family transporter [Alphaproteobacteria bacterium SS10]